MTEMTEWDPTQVNTLIGSTNKLDGNIDLLIAQLKWAKRLAVMALVGVVLVAVSVVFTGVATVNASSSAGSAHDDVVTSNEERAANTIASCIQFNVQRQEMRSALKLSLRALVPGPLSEDQQKVLDIYSGAVDTQLRYRDCSPDGIVDYFKNPPKDPAK